MTEIKLTGIKYPTLMASLKEFKGAQNKRNLDNPYETAKVEDDFNEIALHLLYGGYFEVSGDCIDTYRIYLHTIEFYYHEEDKDGFKDYIVYHRNGKNSFKPAFPVGSLHTHVSGIDLTFEDNRDMDNPRYRASVLIRTFKVARNHNGKWVLENFANPRYKEKPELEAYPTHLYEYLFMKANINGLCIKWIDTPIKNLKDISLFTGKRFNVFLYNEKGKKTETSDGREWAYTKDTQLY
ncbi:MAG: hypothetical protein IK103_08770 [Bacteroidales bacterium]|nr:hypothetical protein [Bacteroidales bacterium]